MPFNDLFDNLYEPPFGPRNNFDSIIQGMSATGLITEPYQPEAPDSFGYLPDAAKPIMRYSANFLTNVTDILGVMSNEESQRIREEVHASLATTPHSALGWLWDIGGELGGAIPYYLLGGGMLGVAAKVGGGGAGLMGRLLAATKIRSVGGIPATALTEGQSLGALRMYNVAANLMKKHPEAVGRFLSGARGVGEMTVGETLAGHYDPTVGRALYNAAVGVPFGLIGRGVQSKIKRGLELGLFGTAEATARQMYETGDVSLEQTATTAVLLGLLGAFGHHKDPLMPQILEPHIRAEMRLRGLPNDRRVSQALADSIVKDKHIQTFANALRDVEKNLGEESGTIVGNIVKEVIAGARGADPNLVLDANLPDEVRALYRLMANHELKNGQKADPLNVFWDVWQNRNNPEYLEQTLRELKDLQFRVGPDGQLTFVRPLQARVEDITPEAPGHVVDTVEGRLGQQTVFEEIEAQTPNLREVEEEVAGRRMTQEIEDVRRQAELEAQQAEQQAARQAHLEALAGREQKLPPRREETELPGYERGESAPPVEEPDFVPKVKAPGLRNPALPPGLVRELGQIDDIRQFQRRLGRNMAVDEVMQLYDVDQSTAQKLLRQINGEVEDVAVPPKNIVPPSRRAPEGGEEVALAKGDRVFVAGDDYPGWIVEGRDADTVYVRDNDGGAVIAKRVDEVRSMTPEEQQTSPLPGKPPVKPQEPKKPKPPDEEPPTDEGTGGDGGDQPPPTTPPTTDQTAPKGVEPPTEPQPTEKPHPQARRAEGYWFIPREGLEIDPERFQFRFGFGKGGSTGRLSGIKQWDEYQAGTLKVWRDPKDGNIYVVDGHNRVAAGDRLGVKEYKVQFIEAANDVEARTKGALYNIKDGNANQFEVAVFLRGSKMPVDKLESIGVNLRSNIVANGFALSKLDDSIFNSIIRGELREDIGVIIGEVFDDPRAQFQFLEYIQKSKNANRSAKQIREMALDLKLSPAGKRSTTQTSLFGDLGEIPLIAERAEITDYIKTKLAREAFLFKFLSDEKRAQLLAQFDNVINTEINEQLGNEARLLLHFFEELRSTGDFYDILNDHAKRLAGSSNANKVKQEAYNEIKEALLGFIKRRGGGEDIEGGGGPKIPRPDSPTEGGGGQSSLFGGEPESPKGTGGKGGETKAPEGGEGGGGKPEGEGSVESDLFDQTTRPPQERKGVNPPPEYGSQNKIISKDKAEEARRRLMEKFKRTSANAPFDPETWADLVTLGVYHAEAGARKFVDWSARMLDDVGEEVKEHLRTLYEATINEIRTKHESTLKEMEGDLNVSQTKGDAGGTGARTGGNDRPGLVAGGREPGGNTGGNVAKSSRLIDARPNHTRFADTTKIRKELRENLADHQQQGAALAIEAMDSGERGFLLADGTGVGKTREMLTVADTYARRGDTVIIFAPNEALGKPALNKGQISGSWVNDAKAMGMSLKYVTAKDKFQYGGGEILISNYTPQNLARHVEAAKARKGKYVVIFDEAHALKNLATGKTRTANLGGTLADNARAVLYATATPIDKPFHIEYLKRIGVREGKTMDQMFRDLGIIKVTTKTGETFWKVDSNVGEAGAFARVEDLFNRMTADGRMLKRELFMGKVDDITDGNGVIVEIERTRLPAEAHQTMRDIEMGLSEGAGIDGVGGLTKAHIRMMQRIQQEPYKIDRAMEIVQSDLKKGRQIVIYVGRVNYSKAKRDIKVYNRISGEWEKVGEEVFAESEGTAKLLREGLKRLGINDFVELHGAADTSAAEAMEAFNSGRARVIIATIQSGGTGINLDDIVGNRPRTMIVLTAPFTALENVQAIGRVWRLTTKSYPHIRYIMSDLDVDDWNIDIIGSKFRMHGATVQGEVGRVDIAHVDYFTEVDVATGRTAEIGRTTGRTELPRQKLMVQSHGVDEILVTGQTMNHREMLSYLGGRYVKGLDGFVLPKEVEPQVRQYIRDIGGVAAQQKGQIQRSIIEHAFDNLKHELKVEKFKTESVAKPVYEKGSSLHKLIRDKIGGC